MDQKQLKQIFLDTDFVHWSGTPEELKVAEYLKAKCEELGVPAHLEGFRVASADIESAQVLADGKEIPCKGFFGCGSGTVAKDKIVLLDTQGFSYFTYQDLMKAGAKGILCTYGNLYYPQTDIDERDLREHVVGDARKVLCAMIHISSAVELVRDGVKRV